jgi:ABC-type uncharacterized transport system permease subunit
MRLLRLQAWVQMKLQTVIAVLFVVVWALPPSLLRLRVVVQVVVRAGVVVVVVVGEAVVVVVVPLPWLMQWLLRENEWFSLAESAKPRKTSAHQANRKARQHSPAPKHPTVTRGGDR